MNWKVNSKNENENIVLYEGYNPSVPLKAWAVLVYSENNKITSIAIFVPPNNPQVSASASSIMCHPDGIGLRLKFVGSMLLSAPKYPAREILF